MTNTELLIDEFRPIVDETVKEIFKDDEIFNKTLITFNVSQYASQFKAVAAFRGGLGEILKSNSIAGKMKQFVNKNVLTWNPSLSTDDLTDIIINDLNINLSRRTLVEIFPLANKGDIEDFSDTSIIPGSVLFINTDVLISLLYDYDKEAVKKFIITEIKIGAAEILQIEKIIKNASNRDDAIKLISDRGNDELKQWTEVTQRMSDPTTGSLFTSIGKERLQDAGLTAMEVVAIREDLIKNKNMAVPYLIGIDLANGNEGGK